MSKSIAIFGEGPTEWQYVNSLRVAKRYSSLTLKPSVPQHSDMRHMLAQAKKCINEGFDLVVCLLDMDRLNACPSEKQLYLKAKQQTTYRKVVFIESDPCTEFWFLLHFIQQPTSKKYSSGDAVITELKKYIPNYTKTEKYLQKVKIFSYLETHGNLKNAINLSKKLTDMHNEQDINSYTEMYKLFQILDECAR